MINQTVECRPIELNARVNESECIKFFYIIIRLYHRAAKVTAVGCHLTEYPLDRKTTFHLAEKNKRFNLAEKYLAYLLYGSVASLPSPSSNIEAWSYGTSLRFASLLHLGH